MKVRIDESKKDSVGYVPTPCIVGDTYKELQVRGYTVGELLTISKQNKNRNIVDNPFITIRDVLSKILKIQEPYTIDDLYLVDIKFAMVYALMLTDPTYTFSYIIRCDKETNPETNQPAQFDVDITPRDYEIDTSLISTKAQVMGYTVRPMKFGDWYKAMQYITASNPETEEDAEQIRLISILASVLDIQIPEGKDSFEYKMELLQNEIPAKVAIEIYKNDYIGKMDIQPTPLDKQCPHCGNTHKLYPGFDIQHLIPSL